MNDSPSTKTTAYRWKPLEDIPADWRDLASTELASLTPIWREQSEKLRQFEGLKEFNTRLNREWAIETGLIEGLYSIDRGTTRLLIEKGIDAALMPHGTTDKPAEQVVQILRDQHDVVEGLFDFVKQKRDLSTSYIKEMHAAFTRNQDTTTAVNGMGRLIEVPLLKGDYKQHPNNPTRPDGQIHEYCPPEHVAAEMDRLIEFHKQHEEAGIPPEVEAAWLHHRFTQIHPFQDGNGRVARALASLIFLRAGWFPLVIDRDMRRRYIETLEIADNGGLQPLTELFASTQRKAFTLALGISDDVLKQPTIASIISAAVQRLKAEQKISFENPAHQKVLVISKRLEALAFERFKDVSAELTNELRQVKGHFYARVDRDGHRTDTWYNRDLLEVAEVLNYLADPKSYRAWVHLYIMENRISELVVSFHSVGSKFVGVLGASAFMVSRSIEGEARQAYYGPHKIGRDLFQFAFNEDPENVESRFRTWLNDVLVTGLDHWRRQL